MRPLKIKTIFISLVLHLSFGPSILLFSQSNEIKPFREHFNPLSISYYETGNKNELITDIITRYSKGYFKPLRHGILNAGIARKSYWIHFSLSNKGAQEDSFMINIDNARLNDLELFELSGNSAIFLGKTGDFYPFSNRHILHKNFLFKVNIPPEQTREYFLNVNQVGHSFILPIKIYTLKYFWSNSFRDYLFDGVTYGILLFVAILSLLLFITSRHNIYLYYSLYIISAIFWFISYFGLGFQYIWGNYPSLNTAVPPATACMNIFLNIQICQTLLRSSKTNGYSGTLSNYTKYALAILAIIPIFINFNKQDFIINQTYLIVFLSVILFAMMIVSSSVILYAYRGLSVARFYLIASLLKAGSIINLALLEFGITPVLYNMEGILQIGIFVEITLLTYALAIRYTDYKSRTYVKVIEAQENERSIISKEIHDSISSSLTGINFGIKNLTRDIEQLQPDKKNQLERIFDELIKVQLEARNISHNTMPEYIKNESVAGIVEKYTLDIQHKVMNNSDGKNYLRINFSSNEQPVNFSEAVKLNLFRIVQEVFANILKHSKATTADIVFSFNKKEMLIIAEDNGTGFCLLNEDSKHGTGIKNIRSRVDLLNGSIEIKSPVYKQNKDDLSHPVEFGTMIKIKIPYRNNLFKNTNGYDY